MPEDTAVDLRSSRWWKGNLTEKALQPELNGHKGVLKHQR